MPTQETSKSTPFERINDFWWVRLPTLVGRMSRIQSAVLADGMYSSAWPIGAFILPIVFMLGFLLGWVQIFSGEVYTFSILLMTALLMVSHLGAALGAFLWLGYVLGDFLLFILIPLVTSQQSYPPKSIFLIVVARFLADSLLGVLLVVMPLAIRGLTRLTMWRLRFFATAILNKLRSSTAAVRPRPSPALQARRGFVILLDIPVQAFLGILLVYLWTQAVATLIRPVYTWHGNSPPIAAIQPLQNLGWLLAILAGVVGMARVVLEFIAENKPEVLARRIKLRQAWGRSESHHRLITALAMAPFKALLLTFLLGGILDSWLQMIVLIVVLLLVFLIRGIAAEYLGFWSRAASYVPILIRLLLALAISYMLSAPIIQILWSQTSSFLPILIGTVISLVVFSILLPAGETLSAQKEVQAKRKP